MFLATYRFIPTASHRMRGAVAAHAFFSTSEPAASSTTTPPPLINEMSVEDSSSQPSAATSTSDRISTEDIVKKVAETHDLSLAETRRILKTTFDTIVDVSLVMIGLNFDKERLTSPTLSHVR